MADRAPRSADPASGGDPGSAAYPDRADVIGALDGSPSAAFLLIALGRVVREQAEAGLGGSGLSLRHLSALGHLSRGPGLSYSELARRARITVQSMQATLNQLEGLGAIERRSTPGRGRAAELHVTEAGRELLITGRRVLEHIDHLLADDLGDDAYDVLSGLLLTAFLAARRAK